MYEQKPQQSNHHGKKSRICFCIKRIHIFSASFFRAFCKYRMAFAPNYNGVPLSHLIMHPCERCCLNSADHIDFRLDHNHQQQPPQPHRLFFVWRRPLRPLSPPPLPPCCMIDLGEVSSLEAFLSTGGRRGGISEKQWITRVSDVPAAAAAAVSSSKQHQYRQHVQQYRQAGRRKGSRRMVDDCGFLYMRHWNTTNG